MFDVMFVEMSTVLMSSGYLQVKYVIWQLSFYSNMTQWSKQQLHVVYLWFCIIKLHVYPWFLYEKIMTYFIVHGSVWKLHVYLCFFSEYSMTCIYLWVYMKNTCYPCFFIEKMTCLCMVLNENYMFIHASLVKKMKYLAMVLSLKVEHIPLFIAERELKKSCQFITLSWKSYFMFIHGFVFRNKTCNFIVFY